MEDRERDRGIEIEKETDTYREESSQAGMTSNTTIVRKDFLFTHHEIQNKRERRI